MTKNGHKDYITFVLDETGSMGHVKDQTISGFNEFIDSQQDKSLGEARVTLVKFNSTKVETVYSDMLIEDVPALTPDTYQPDALTPLYDAIAQAIKETEKRAGVAQQVLSKLAGHPVKAGPMVIIVIMTDGEENASKQYDRDGVFKMIKEKQSQGWAFVFLGANQDSWATAQPIGIAVGSTASYNPLDTMKAFASTSRCMSAYRSSYHDLTDQFGTGEIGEKEFKASLKTLSNNYWQSGKLTKFSYKENDT